MFVSWARFLASSRTVSSNYEDFQHVCFHHLNALMNCWGCFRLQWQPSFLSFQFELALATESSKTRSASPASGSRRPTTPTWRRWKRKSSRSAFTRNRSGGKANNITEQPATTAAPMAAAAARSRSLRRRKRRRRVKRSSDASVLSFLYVFLVGLKRNKIGLFVLLGHQFGFSVTLMWISTVFVGVCT